MALPPEKTLRGALRVLFIAAVYTRNWTLTDEVSRKQVNDLWEAIHEIPDLLTRWGDDSEAELLRYLQEYAEKWQEPNLIAGYEDGVARSK
jgi:pyruvate-formate lyase-activating enzyme